LYNQCLHNNAHGQESQGTESKYRHKVSLILDQEGTVAWQIRPVAGSYMQLPLSGPQCSGGTPGPGPIFQCGPPPNVMVQQGPMGGVLLAGPPLNQPPHLHPAMSLPPGHPSAMGVGSVMGDPLGGPVHFTCFNLESRLSDMNRRLLQRPRE
uniref:Uncharacterized protein n=1 Tax=Romanomermis culicivorax TaxID=13658 RepID=A0A915IVH0_ROMCU